MQKKTKAKLWWVVVIRELYSVFDFYFNYIIFLQEHKLVIDKICFVSKG